MDSGDKSPYSIAHVLVPRSDVRDRPALIQFGVPTCLFALVIWQIKCLAISKSCSRCQWNPPAAKPAKSSIRRLGAVSDRPLRNGANFPTVGLNLRYGIFRLGIDPKIAVPPIAVLANPGEQRGGTAATLDLARADFEAGWRRFSVRRTPADYQAWRDQRDWMARKYATWERGDRFPSQQASR